MILCPDFMSDVSFISGASRFDRPCWIAPGFFLADDYFGRVFCDGLYVGEASTEVY